MKKIQSIVLFLAGLTPMLLSGQFHDPVSVKASVDESARAGEVVTVTMVAEMEEGWHIYAVHDVPEGPVSSVMLVVGEAVDRVGIVDEPDPIVKYDEGFELTTPYHEGRVEFVLPVLLNSDLSPGMISLKASLVYQSCNDVMCYPPKEFSEMVTVNIEAGSPRESQTSLETEGDPSGFVDLDTAIQKGFWSFILLSLSMGFLALLTPCVFPMIPITVSFFTHQGEIEGKSPIKQASVYALGIIATFAILGLLLAAFLGASGANQIAANPWVNLFIGGLFIYFALSLFGMYEIQLPQFLRQATVKNESRGGYVGILFMALTFTLTSFTCTVQFLGLLLVAASQGQWFWPALGMIIFATAFATPFFFLALFPQYLAKMPKSGGWLNSVKVVMGFLEFAAAFKFLSNTDLVWNWGFFTHSTVLAVWTIISLLTGIYLLGKIRLPHDSPMDTVGVPRMLLSLFFLTFALYLGTGLLGRPIHGLIYSYLPPKLESETGLVVTNGSIAESYHWYSDLNEGLQAARQVHKPVFVDFTGYTCTNCRWMEANVFTDERVKQRFEKFVLVQLYTDAGENYREKQQYEIERFGTAALPYYVILSPEDDVIAEYPGLTRNIDEFVRFLDKGLKYYK